MDWATVLIAYARCGFEHPVLLKRATQGSATAPGDTRQAIALSARIR